MVGTGLGAKNGVLIKGGEILEKANDLDILLFDKTGTLTTGLMSLSNYKVINEKMSAHLWWSLIGGVESNSEHPIGQALVKIAKKELGLFEEDLFGAVVKSFESITGLGVKGKLFVDNEEYEIVVGNKKLAEQVNVTESIPESSDTILYVIINGSYQGFIELIDEVKPSARAVIDYLKYNQKYVIGIVTGDNAKTAEKIGAQLGIGKSNIFSEVTPVNKDRIVVELREKFGGEKNVKIAFIGDGINDAPALSQADIGIAISNGTDIAIESANMVIMNEKNDIVGIPMALDISKKTFQRIKLNFLWATVYNIIMVPFAMGCFLPLGIMLPPMAAGLSMAFSSISVVLSSLLLNRWTFDMDPKRSYKDLENRPEFDLKGYTLRDFNDHKKGKRFWR
jgi:Cu+-exporting ATPase